ncbi:thioredoxin domain-containing protein [Hydrocarboniphaga sp.]|uniref:thioredoxin domain-containing protein n=1 Tax=Hydrocarboniphaga sp. TaxID=2033016 RepID=UPI003D0A38B0
MKSLSLTLTLLLSLFANLAQAGDKPMAVWFYADWCMNCKMLAPKLAQVQPEFEQRIEFVKLDVTNEERKAASREQSKKLGVYPLYMANKATGWIALIDTQGKQVGEIRHFMSVDEMREALNQLAGP